MNKLLFLTFFCLTLWGNELQREYFYTQSTIFSTDIFPDVSQRFEVLKIPGDKIQYRVDGRIIAKTFELHGIAVDISKAPFVTFSKKSPVDFAPLKEQLSQMLQTRYPSMQINQITITPRGYLPTLSKGVKGEFDERSYLSREGTFYVIGDDGLRRYLDYSVDATLRVLHAAQNVSRKEVLNGSNAIAKIVPFGSFRDKPLTRFPEHSCRFRSNLKAGFLLTERNVEELPLVLKNDRVVVVVQNGGVVVEFLAVATQEGSLYDIITIQKRDGKRAKAKVIGENRVELQ